LDRKFLQPSKTVAKRSEAKGVQHIFLISFRLISPNQEGAAGAISAGKWRMGE